MIEVQEVRCELRVDDEFRSLIPPLSEDERAGLDLNAEMRRLNPPPKRRDTCYVCGKYASICHAHHVPALAEVVGVFGVVAAQMASIPCVWLCPTHHALWHALHRSPATMKHLESWSDLSEAEKHAYESLDKFTSKCWRNLSSLAAQIRNEFPELFGGRDDR